MSKKKETLYHIIFWILFIGMNELSKTITKENYSFSILQTIDYLPFALLQMLIFYANYLYVCPKTVPAKKWTILIVAQLGLVVAFAGIRYFIEEVVMYYITGYHNYADESRKLVFYVYDNSYFSVRILLYSLVFYFLKYAWQTTQQMSNLQLDKKQAELQALKNQLSPHFLFNTLNSFYSDLFDTQPKVADDILKLSEMLRYVTYENENDTVLVNSEVEFLENYIALFNRRFDNQIPIQFNYTSAQLQGKIPSLLLIHFVENAFKHGILDDPEKPIDIDLTINENRLQFNVNNYYRASEHYDEPGIGQKNIEQRLSILFPENYILEVKETAETYRIYLNIPVL